MGKLNPQKLHVIYLTGTNGETLTLPRRYTLTHSDLTGDLFLSIGREYDMKQVSGLYTRLMRDEVLAEIDREGDVLKFKVYCHISGGFILGTAKWRYKIFHSELPLVLEAIRYGDSTIFEKNTVLDNAPVHIYFQSTNKKYNKTEYWGIMADYSY
jgi:hypothetical protein